MRCLGERLSTLHAVLSSVLQCSLWKGTITLAFIRWFRYFFFLQLLTRTHDQDHVWLYMINMWLISQCLPGLLTQNDECLWETYAARFYRWHTHWSHSLCTGLLSFSPHRGRVLRPDPALLALHQCIEHTVWISFLKLNSLCNICILIS